MNGEQEVGFCTVREEILEDQREADASSEGQAPNEGRIPASQGSNASTANERQEGLLIRFWKWLFYQPPSADQERERERTEHTRQVTYLTEQIKGLEREREKLLDRLLFKNSIPPLQGQAKAQPAIKVKQAAYERAIVQTQQNVEQRKQQQAEFRNQLRARGINLGNIDPSVLDDLQDEMSM